MELFSEEELQEYVEYWGGSLETIANPDYRKGRKLSAVIFYLLHHPEDWPAKEFWKRNIREAVTFLWDWLRVSKTTNDRLFRTPECKAYFQLLLNGYIECYGLVEVFKFRHQNWHVVDCQTMVDQLWTVLEAQDSEA